MRTQSKLFSVLFVAMLFASQLFAQVKADFDGEVDFTKYKTYTFMGWEKNSDQILNDLDKKRILDAFQHELTIRGMTQDDGSPDIGITLYIVVENKTSTTAYTNYNGGMGYGMGRYGGWGYGGMGMGSSTTTYSENDYLQGTTVIDFYDESTKKLVFQGVFSKKVTENPKKRDKTIPKNVKKLMAKYPVKPAK
jgi:hypothetical protein